MKFLLQPFALCNYHSSLRQNAKQLENQSLSGNDLSSLSLRMSIIERRYSEYEHMQEEFWKGQIMQKWNY